MRPEVGRRLGPHRVGDVTADRMETIARILDDPNPIHLDPEAVRRLGMGDGRINQGPANLAYVIDMLAAALPDARLERVSVRFLANVFEGDDVVAAGSIEAVEEKGPELRVHCAVWLDTDAGVRAVDGAATVLVS